MDIIHHKQTPDSDQGQQLGPYKIETLISADQEAQLTAYRVHIEAHQVTSESYHKIAEECYYVLSGSGIATLNGTDYQLSKGDFLRLPPRTQHRFRTGEHALAMLDIHSPGSRPDKDVYFVGETPDGFQSKN